MISQNEQILSHLLAGGSLTHMEAIKRFQCARLASRISDLKKLGHDIDSEMIELQNGKRVARYSMETFSARLSDERSLVEMNTPWIIWSHRHNKQAAEPDGTTISFSCEEFAIEHIKSRFKALAATSKGGAA